jgi:gliding motility-associated-like protein
MGRMNFKTPGKVIFGILLVLSVDIAKAQQGLCPPNMDFEYADFSNWACNTGTVAEVSGRNVITWTGASEVPGQHTIIPSLNAGNDQYGRFPRICPNGSGYSVKLGNNDGGRGAEKISYTYTIPSTLQGFSLLFHYAVVLQNPGHEEIAQPRFQAIITDLSSGARIPCSSFDFAASFGLPGFQQSTVDWSVVYKDWTPVTVNLNGYIGRTIRIEFITSDCTRGGHFGYAYVDINSNCNGAILGTTLCQGDNSISLTAPHGFQSYQWYSDTRFTTLLDTFQVLPLNPPPSVGSVYPVIVFPYQGYGCIDTLYATISVATKPVSVAGRDTSLCKYQSVQLGGSPASGLMYSWTPANFVNNPIIPDPVAGLGASITPTQFIIKTTDVLTGCFSYDTVLISPIAIDTAIRLIGNASFCDDNTETLLTLRNNNAGIQWYNNATTISGATTLSYQPTISGVYWAQLAERGCTDTTARLNINVNPLPQAAFTINNDTFCITNNSFVFTNRSTVSDNSQITYNWRFSDGSNLQTTHATKTFNVVGTYRTQLMATTFFGCKDSIDSYVHVMPIGIPDFSWDTICTNRPVLFSNLSNENGSVSVQYNWTFNNGGPGSPLKNPLPVTYTSNGTFDVTLQLKTLGCESDPKQVTKKIKVSSPLAGIRYKDITVPINESRMIKIRDTVGSIYNWKPHIQLSNYNSPVTEFFANGNDVRYLIDITDKNTCVTTDTFLVQILKKPGYYLPSAFTPNGDGLNDVITPYIVGMKSLKGFSIFNRWGNRVFYTTKYGESWDGKYGGTVQPVGVFAWILEYYTTDDKLVTAKGTITIIR